MLHCHDIGRAHGKLRALRTPVSDGSSHSAKTAANNAPVRAAQPAGSRGAILAAHARSLDSRLQVAAQTDRQATRRAAAHVVQLARRIARLLPRVPSLLPVLPDGGRDTRVRHYVLQAQQVAGTTGTRILTISTHSVLRYGEFDGSGRHVLWNEYDPLQPVAGWDLEIVLERLAQVLGQIQEQVEHLEARVAERASTLNSLLNAAPLQRSAGSESQSGSAPAVAAKAAAFASEPPAAVVSRLAPIPTSQQALHVPGLGVEAVADPDAPLVSYGGERPASSTPVRPATRAIPESTAIDAAMGSGRDGAVDGAMAGAIDGTIEGTMDDLSLIDLAFTRLEHDVATEVPHDPTHDDSLDSLFEKVGARTTLATDAKSEAAPDVKTAEAGSERERRERRLFQHLRVR